MAISKDTFSFAGGAVNDLFAGFGAQTRANMAAEGINIQAGGTRIKAQGDLAEASNYGLSAGLARQNEQYVIESEAIQQKQLDRQIALTIGGQRADVAGAGFKESGTALDLLADSSAQGALAKEVLSKQSLITEAGYEEQAKSYDTMQSAATMAYQSETQIAARQDQLAAETRTAGQQEMWGDFASAAVKGIAAVALL